MELFAHQKKAIDFALKNNGCGALLMDTGTGKTRTALEIFRQINVPDIRLLVICPISLIESAWGDDIKKFTDFEYVNLRKKLIHGRIMIMNFEMLLSAKNIDFIKKMPEPIMCVVDESSRVKNNRSRTTKVLLSLRNKFAARIVMSGTPCPNTEAELWPQITFVGDILHRNFYVFRNQYFHLARGSQVMNGTVINKHMAREIFSKGWKYAITPDSKKKLMDGIAPWTFFCRKQDCLDLPDQVDEVRVVELPPDIRRHYHQMKNECIIEINSMPIVAQTALTRILRLRQITSGFALGEVPVSFKGSPKINELQDILEEAGDQQVIIWCQFHKEIDMVTSVLGEKCCTLYGLTKDKDASINAFKSGEKQYLVAHPRSASFGLTFINCSLQIFYSMDYSWEMYEQARARTHRAGQVNKCTYIHIVAGNTIDEHILDALRKKKDAVELLYSYIGIRPDQEGQGRHQKEVAKV